MFRLLFPLALTIIIECGLAHIIYRDKQTTYHTLLANVLTNPAVNLIIIGVTLFADQIGINAETAYTISFIILEIAVLFVEYKVYRYIGHEKRKSLILTLPLNITSCLTGLALSLTIL